MSRGLLGKQAESLHADLQGRAEVSEEVLEADADMAVDAALDPAPRSGRQEHLENEVNRAIWSVS